MCAQFQNDLLKHVGGVGHTRHPSIYTLLRQKMTKITALKKKRINLRKVKKTHACFQTMIKPVQFQQNQHKTVGGVALTWYLLPKHFRSIQAQIKSKLKM